MSLLVDIEKDFGKFKLNVNFQAGNGIMGLLGASGCGKSMTLKCIAGIVTPDRGKIVVNDKVLFDSERKINLTPQQRRIGLLFQNYALFPNMNVFQNIYTGIHREKLDRKEKEQIIFDMIEKFHLQGLEKRKPQQLSGGQQQRVALARILVSKPEILMLDEPFSALDSYLRWELETELADLLEEYGKTAILVSHDRDEIYRLCTSASVISEGRVCGSVSVEQMFTHPQSIAEALLSGCKNISMASRTSPHSFYAHDWGIELWTKRVIPENLKGVGIQAAHIRISGDRSRAFMEKNNEFVCRINRRIDDRLSCIYVLTPVNASQKERRHLRADIDKNHDVIPSDWEFVSIKIDDQSILFFCS